MQNSVTYTQALTPAVGANVVGSAINCIDYVIQGIELVGSDTANFTVMVVMSYDKDFPDFPTLFASATEGNVAVKDKATDSLLNAATGVVFAADGTKHVEVNADAARYVGVFILGNAANTGELAVKFSLKDNR